MKLSPLALLLICPLFTITGGHVFNRWAATSQEPLVTPKSPVDVHALIQAAAEKHGVRAALVKSIVAVESAFNCDAVSPRGAVGLMQMMPQTASEYGVDPTIPEQNIDGGTRYLGFLVKKYRKYKNGLKLAIAAYNAGPGMVDKYRRIPPFRETRMYVTRVLAFLAKFERKRA